MSDPMQTAPGGAPDATAPTPTDEQQDARDLRALIEAEIARPIHLDDTHEGCVPVRRLNAVLAAVSAAAPEWCPACGGVGTHGLVHTRFGNGGGRNVPCPNAAAAPEYVDPITVRDPWGQPIAREGGWTTATAPDEREVDWLAVLIETAQDALNNDGGYLAADERQQITDAVTAALAARPAPVVSGETVLSERVADLLTSLVDPDDCWFDHHGGCQAHGYLSLRPGEMCPQAEAKELLRQYDRTVADALAADDEGGQER